MVIGISGFLGLYRVVASVVKHWVQRNQQRNQLRRLDQRALSDIGITRREALQEADKPFWEP